MRLILRLLSPGLFLFTVLVVLAFCVHPKQGYALSVDSPHTLFDSPVISMVFSPDGSMLAFTGSGVVTVMSFPKFEPILSTTTSQGKVFLAFSHDGQFLVVGDSAGKISLWDLGTGELKTIIQSALSITALSFTGNNEQILVGDTTGYLYCYGSISSTLWQKAKTCNSAVAYFFHSPDREKSKLITACQGGGLVVWAWPDGGINYSETGALLTGASPIRAVLFTTLTYNKGIDAGEIIQNPKLLQREHVLVTYATDNSVKFWQIRTIKKNKKDNEKVAFSLMNSSKLGKGINDSLTLAGEGLAVRLSPGKLSYYALKKIRKYIKSAKDKELDELMRGIPFGERGIPIDLVFPEVTEVGGSVLGFAATVFSITPDAKYIVLGDNYGEIMLVKNSVLVETRKKIIASGDKAFSAAKYGMAEDLYQEAYSIYPDDNLKKAISRSRQARMTQELEFRDKIKQAAKINSKRG